MAGKIVSQTTDKKTVLDITDNGVIEGVYSIQRADKIIDRNRVERNAHQRGSLIGNTQKHWQKVADIPETLYYDLVAKLGKPADNPTEWKKWLNDYDNRFFRTSEGSV